METTNAGSVKFVLVDRQLKLFRLGLQSLHKIGAELLLEALPSKLSLRSINSAHTAFMSVSYAATFFDSYDVYNCDVVQAGLLMKHMLTIFRSQRLDSIVFELNSSDARVTITLNCENGLIKTYKMPSMDTEILQTTVNKEAFPTLMVAELGRLNRLLSSFTGGHNEITLVARPESAEHEMAVLLQSFIDPSKTENVDKSLFIKVAVDPRETFVEYVHNSDTETDVTFNLRDFRAMLGLCEGLGVDVMIRLEGPGQPIVLEPHLGRSQGQEDCKAELVLATLMESHATGVVQDPLPNRFGAGAGAHGMRTPAGALVHSPHMPGDTPHGNGEGTEPASGDGGRQSSLPRLGRSVIGPSRFGQEASLAQPRQGLQLSGLEDDPMLQYMGNERTSQQPGGAQAAWQAQGVGGGGGAAAGDYGAAGSWEYPASGLEGSAEEATDAIPSTPPEEQHEFEAGGGAPGVIG